MENNPLMNQGIKIKLSSDRLWYKIDEEFGANGGVYILKCADDSNDFLPISINRLLNCDTDGILYIGKANSYKDRVIDLKKSISSEYISSSHECGVRYKSNIKITDKFPFDNLYIELHRNDNPLELEKKFLSEYETMFGELPPLNRIS